MKISHTNQKKYCALLLNDLFWEFWIKSSEKSIGFLRKSDWPTLLISKGRFLLQLGKKAFNRITGKHIAFIVYNANDLSIIGAIELIKKTHQGTGRQVRDQSVSFRSVEATQRRLYTVYHPLKQGSGNILGFKIVGGVTKRQKEEICKVLEKQIRESGKIRLLFVIEPLKTIDAESMLFDLNFTLTYADQIERMALIGNKKWEETWIALFGLFSHIKTRYFDRSQIKAAWEWIHG